MGTKYAHNGKLVTFEGCEGVGKSTQIRLLEQKLGELGIDALFTREPGGTEVGERIRELLKDESLEMCAETERCCLRRRGAKIPAASSFPRSKRAK